MKKLDQFLKEHVDLSEEEFTSRYDHGFLVVSAGMSESTSSGREFHTKLADDIKESITSSYGSTEIFFLVKKDSTLASAMVTVGRAGNNDVVLSFNAISKLHAYFKVNRMGKFTVSDVGSTNGTVVDNKPLVKGEPVELRGGEIIVFGSALEATFHTPTTLYRHIKILKRWIN
jgi:hypothetical protein